MLVTIQGETGSGHTFCLVSVPSKYDFQSKVETFSNSIYLKITLETMITLFSLFISISRSPKIVFGLAFCEVNVTPKESN